MKVFVNKPADPLLACAQAIESGVPGALATIVEVQGSAYRGPGARLFIAADGFLAGSISGGCLEGDVRRRAKDVMAQRRAEVVTYDGTFEEDRLWGFGTGCEGHIHILIEPLGNAGTDTYVRSILEARSARRAQMFPVAIGGDACSGIP